MKPINTGITLCVTVMLFYSLCTLAEMLWPAQFMAFMNALFHGIEFGKLSSPARFSWTSFVGALLIMGVWTFAAGTFFGWLHELLSVRRVRGAVRHS
jgi:hypothetical protein